MADLGNSRNWLVSPTEDIKKKWILCQIQERKSQVVRLRQDIEDLQKGQIVKLEATIMMLEKEINKLNDELNCIDIESKVNIDRG